MDNISSKDKKYREPKDLDLKDLKNVAGGRSGDIIGDINRNGG